MIISRQNKDKNYDGEITFPPLQCLNPETNIATIIALVGKERVSCKIKIKDLKKKFYNFNDDPMILVTRYRPSIESAIRNLIKERSFDDEGAVIVQYKHLK